MVTRLIQKKLHDSRKEIEKKESETAHVAVLVSITVQRKATAGSGMAKVAAREHTQHICR